MIVNKDKVYLDTNDEVSFAFRLAFNDTTATDMADMIHNNLVHCMRDNGTRLNHGENKNVRVDKSHTLIQFMVENYENGDSRFKDEKDRCTFDVELLLGKNHMVYGKANNFRTYYDDIYESAVSLNKPDKVINLVTSLDSAFGKFQTASFQFNRDGVVYRLPVMKGEVEKDLVHCDIEKHLFENRKFNSDKDLREVMDEFAQCRNDGTPFLYVNFRNCDFKDIDFDKFQNDFEGMDVTFSFCHMDNVHMSEKFAGEYGVLLERNVGANRSVFENIVLSGGECAFNECTFDKCDMYNLQLCDFSNCEGLKESKLLFDSNLVKESHYELGNEIYIEERIGASNSPKEFDLEKIWKTGNSVLFEEEDIPAFYDKNKALLKDRVFTFIKDLSPEDMKYMTYDDKREFFRSSLENELANCSFIIRTDGNEVFKDDKFYKEQYLSTGNIYDEISNLAVKDLLEENKIRHNGYGFYDVVEQKKSLAPKGRNIKQIDHSLEK